MTTIKEIKFRVWDNILKEWWIESATLWDLFAEVDDDILFGELGSDRVKKRLVFLQNTGLLDKNGKEIYEGDIVKHSRGNVGKVKFVLGCFQITWQADRGGMIPTKFFNEAPSNYHEVIGNIYENPELLEKQ